MTTYATCDSLHGQHMAQQFPRRRIDPPAHLTGHRLADWTEAYAATRRALQSRRVTASGYTEDGRLIEFERGDWKLTDRTIARHLRRHVVTGSIWIDRYELGEIVDRREVAPGEMPAAEIRRSEAMR